MDQQFAPTVDSDEFLGLIEGGAAGVAASFDDGEIEAIIQGGLTHDVWKQLHQPETLLKRVINFDLAKVAPEADFAFSELDDLVKFGVVAPVLPVVKFAPVEHDDPAARLEKRASDCGSRDHNPKACGPGMIQCGLNTVTVERSANGFVKEYGAGGELLRAYLAE
jgi:hypothetical protein